MYANKSVRIAGNGKELVPTGIAFAIPVGYFGKVYERSGVSINLSFGIKAGVIDADYTGEVVLIVRNEGEFPDQIDVGMKLAQIAFHEVPPVELTEVDVLPETARGKKGFGSSDKK